jgi:Ca-activated chloride channel family protein
LDEQTEENGDNLDIDISDKGSDQQEADEGTGGEEDQEQQETGTLADRSADPGGMPDEISEEEEAASQAVDRFDQMEAGLGEIEEGAEQPGMPEEDTIPGTGVSMIIMDQWLEQIEGDPAYLLLNQFRIEEQQELQRYGRRLIETRPW